MNQYLITAIFDAVLAVFAYRRRGDVAARALAYFLFSASIWSLELYILSSYGAGEALDFLFHLTRWGMFFIPPCFALFTWRLLGCRPRSFLRYVVLPGFVATIALCIANMFFFPSKLVQTESGYLPQVDIMYFGFMACFLWCFVASFTLSLMSFKGATNRGKQKVKWLVITVLACFICGAVNLLFMPHDFYLSKYFASATNILWVGLLFYATVQHNLMDFRLAISVGLSRAILLGFLVWTLFLFMSVVGPLDEASGGAFALVILLVAMLELYPRLLNWVLPNTKKLFVGDVYDFDKTKLDMQNALNDSVNMKGFVSVLDHYLLQVMKVRNYSVLLVDKEFEIKPLGFEGKLSVIDDKHELLAHASSVFGLVMTDETPIEIQEKLSANSCLVSLCVRFESRPIALVMIGESVSHSYYSYDDIRLLEWMQKELGQSLHRISQLDEMQHQLGQAKKTLSMLGVMNHYHHDIKAPLAIIDGVLSNDIYDRDKQKDIVLQQVERGSQLIATMAGILKGERKRKVQPLCLQEVVKDSVFLFGQGIDDIHYLFADVPKINGDAEDLKILVINIVKNAMEARRPGERLELTVSTWITDDNVCLSLSDTGVGIPSELLDILWEDVTSVKKHGSGIGLQAIKRIADEHEAEIDVNSQEGEGTSFVFKFPLSIVAPEDEPVCTDEQEENIFTQKRTC